VQSRQGRLRLPPERAGLNVTELFLFQTDAATKKAAVFFPG